MRGYNLSSATVQELQGGMKKEPDDEKITRQFMPIIIRRYRDKAGLSQQQAADAAGISKGYLNGMERGKDMVNVDMLVKLARVYSVRPGEMLDAMVDESEK